MKANKLNLRPIFFTLLATVSIFFTGQSYALAVCPPLGCNDNNPCTTDKCVTSTVNGLQSCSYVNNTASCSDDGNQCTSDICSNGACTHPKKSAGTACNDGSACTTDKCNALGACVSTAITCNDNKECTSDSCDPIKGCVYDATKANGSACTPDMNQCTTDLCFNGSCRHDSAVNCDDGNICTTDSCNAASGCVHANNTATCDDNNACTTGDVCKAGACTAGTPLSCNDNKVCTDDSCVPATGCVYTNDNTNTCSDGNACTQPDTCQAGLCTGSNPKACAASDQCHIAGTCNPSTGICSDPPIADGTSCNDSNKCTKTDICSSGTCGGTPYICDDEKACTNNICDGNGGCSYNTLVAGYCKIGGECYESGAVNPINPCQICDPKTPNKWSAGNEDGTCSDGNECTTGDVCKAGACTAGAAASCNDGNVCTDDSCAPATGCVYTKDNTNTCSDDKSCTTDACSNGTCVGTPNNAACNDGNICTTDSCNPTAQGANQTTGCLSTNNTASCNDSNACTKIDTCSSGTCAGTSYTCAAPTECQVSNACDGLGGCTTINKSQGAGCTDDGKTCTDDKCDGVGGCTHPVKADTCLIDTVCRASGEENPSNPCQECDPAQSKSAWSNRSNGFSCADSNLCDGAETCQNGTCVENGTPLNCNDNKVCTDDSCAPATGCVYTKDNTNTCSDDKSCTTDACSNGTCVGTPNNAACNDENICTTDACSPSAPGANQTTGCLSTNNTASCNDSNACTSGDACSAGACKGSQVTYPEDACNTYTCDEATTGLKKAVPKSDGTPCADNDLCNGAEVCKAGACVAGTSVTCNMPPSGCYEAAGTCQTNGLCKYTLKQTGVVCSTGLKGICAEGKLQCVDGNYLCKQTNTVTIEICGDTDDSDCDGQLDVVTEPSGVVKKEGDVCKSADQCNNESKYTCNIYGKYDCLDSYVGVGTPCDDGNVCTGADYCDGKGKCLSGTKPPCDDKNACTTDTCSTATGCVHTNNTNACNDGDNKTINDVCSGGACKGTAVECLVNADCGASNACETRTCVANKCKITPVSCNDGNACTADSCDTSKGCQHGADTTNQCGGCAVLEYSIGSQCGKCGSYGCSGGDALACNDPGFNACGNCDKIDTTDTDKDGKPDVCDDEPECGNGELEGKEVCDNGPLNSDKTPNACRMDCTNPFCGDGVWDDLAALDRLAEACDDGNTDDTDLCRNDCSSPTCGDSIVSKNEVCDDGVRNGKEGSCNATCSEMTPYCGDDRISKDIDEECEGANLSGATCESKGYKGGGELACGTDCRFDIRNCSGSLCRDGVLDAGEDCDGSAGITDPIHQKCEACKIVAIPPACGNTVVDGDEPCDPTADSPNCREDCTVITCGDGIRDAGEECDAGIRNGDNAECLTSCKLATCGDNLIQTEKDPKEQCDDGLLANNDTTPDACRTDCRTAWCGDGVPDTGEVCDGGALKGTRGKCNASCSGQYNTCGDEIFVKGERNDNGVIEECEGVNLGGATCEALGHKGGGELACGTDCRFDQTACIDTWCGDGIKNGSEQCDVVPLASAAPQPIDCGTILPGTMGNATCEACSFNTSQCFAPECAEGERRRGCSLGEAPSSCSEGEETCSGGKWGACLPVNVADGTACDDGNTCTENNICQNGACVAGVQMSCDDGNACTQDSCSAGTCVNTAIGGCCNLDSECADTNVCTADTCDVARHTCAHNAIQGCCQPAKMTTRCDITNQLGTCSGTKVCGDDGNYGACLGRAPAAEICNGADDNCDGRTDEGLTQECRLACGAGVEVCQNGKWAGCNAPQPATEVCDGKDNDCDGQIDELVKNMCGLCGEAPVEICGNNKDDNCDGVTDEGCAKADLAPEPKPEFEPELEPGVGHSNIFDLKAARAIKIDGKLTGDIKVIDKGKDMFVLVPDCNGETCGMATLYMKDFKRKVDPQTDSAEQTEETKPQFVIDSAVAGKFAGFAAIVSETKDALVMYNDKCITIIPDYPKQKIETDKPEAVKIEMVKTDICPQDYGVCDGDIEKGEVKDSDISVTVKCATGYQIFKLTSDTEKNGKLEATVETVENMPPPSEPEQEVSQMLLAEEDLKHKDKIVEKFGSDFDKMYKNFAFENFEVGKFNVVVAGPSSIRLGEAEGENAENVTDIVKAYPETDESYPCDSVIDGVYHSTDTDRLIPIQFSRPVWSVSMNDHGGEDLMVICQWVNTKEVVFIFIPNLDEAPVSRGVEVDGEVFVDGTLNVENKEEVTLKGIFDDPTNDILAYTWECTDASGADCRSEFSAMTGATVKVRSTKASAAAESGFQYPYTIKVTGTDAGGLSASSEISVESSGVTKAAGAAEAPVEPPQVETGWTSSLWGGGCGRLSLMGDDEIRRGNDMKFIIVIPALIGLAIFLFIAARLNKMRAVKVKRSCHSDPPTV